MSGELKKTVYYSCPCGYKYDPAEGDLEARYEPGTRFEDLPNELTCPRCQRAKIHFREKRKTVQS